MVSVRVRDSLMVSEPAVKVNVSLPKLRDSVGADTVKVRVALELREKDPSVSVKEKLSSLIVTVWDKVNVGVGVSGGVIVTLSVLESEPV